MKNEPLKILWTILFLLGAYLVRKSRADCLWFYYETGSCLVKCNASMSRLSENCKTIELSISSSVRPVLRDEFFSVTNFDSKVTEIHAVNNDWRRLSNGCLRYYGNTRKVNLSSNEIEIIDDDSFRNLIVLSSLDLSENLISEIMNRSFVTSENSQLNELFLSKNRFTTLRSTYLNYLPSLQLLDLSHNNILHIEDNTFNKLSSLKKLLLNNNNLSSINSSLQNLNKLEYLDISMNSIKALSDSELRLPLLKFLNISFNVIEFVESSTFRQSFDLQLLDVSHNKIKNDFEDYTFMNNNKLKYLDMYSNNISLIPDKMFKHLSLSYINITGNNISNEINELTFLGCSNVTYMDLSYQSIPSLGAKAFAPVLSLQYLNLSNNKIAEINETSFENVIALKILDLSFNSITNTNFTSNCLPSLVILHLQHNKLKVLPSKTFENQTKMTHLDLSYNEIKFIHSFSLPLDSIQYLFIRGNSISQNLSKNVFSPARFLRKLDLSQLELPFIEDYSFQSLKLIAEINVSHSRVRTIAKSAFISLDNIFSLDLSSNELKSIDFELNGLKSLKALYLNNNQITEIKPDTFRELTLLQYLELSSNYIVDLDHTVSLPSSLSYISFANNNLHKFDGAYAQKIKHLKSLNLSGNSLSTFNASVFESLTNLDLSINFIKDVAYNDFMNLRSLIALNLSNNSIYYLTPGTLRDLGALRLLNLSRNHIDCIRYGYSLYVYLSILSFYSISSLSFRGLSEMTSLDISYNKLTEMDIHILHDCTKLLKLIVDSNAITTFDIEHLQELVPNIVELSIGGNNIDCKLIVKTLKNNKSFAITALQRQYHEDNVHGILCDKRTLTNNRENSVDVISVSHVSTLLIIWCALLTLVVLGFMSAYYFYRRKLWALISNKYNLKQRSSSLELRSEY